jgi:hypothetical protein
LTSAALVGVYVTVVVMVVVTAHVDATGNVLRVVGITLLAEDHPVELAASAAEPKARLPNTALATTIITSD